MVLPALSGINFIGEYNGHYGSEKPEKNVKKAARQ